jgi:hypothetical protein
MPGSKKINLKRSNLITGLLLFFMSNCFGQHDSSNQKVVDSNAPDISFETEFHDFGVIRKGDIINYNFKFKNIGNQPLVITNVNTGCDCTTAEWTKDSIKAGESSFIKITYKSDEEGGDQAKEITVTFNANIPVKILRFTGYVDFSSNK